MIPLETVGNPGLESEYLASCILKGLIETPEYLELRMNIASLQFIDVSQKLLTICDEIQKKTVSNFGLVERPIVKQYYYGKAPELKELIDEALKEVYILSQFYKMAVPEKQAFIETVMQHDIENSPMTYEDIGQNINKYQVDQNHLDELYQTHIKLEKMQGVLKAIERIYRNNAKLSTKEFAPKYDTKYRLYIQDLLQNIDKATHNPIISMNVAKAIDAIQSTAPKDDLDPYIMDVCNNVIEALTEPESFYNMCKRDQIVSSSVGQMFGHCYPEFYNKFLDMYIEDVPKLEHQEVLDFRKCFGLDSDDSELVALCSPYVKLGFTKQ
jgi:hypothetical protein